MDTFHCTAEHPWTPDFDDAQRRLICHEDAYEIPGQSMSHGDEGQITVEKRCPHCKHVWWEHRPLRPEEIVPASFLFANETPGGKPWNSESK
jgi:hypothetical protein